MALDDENVRRLDLRAQEVGSRIGWKLRFHALGNPEYVALSAGPDQVVIIGPSKLAELGVHDIDLELDALERGDRIIRGSEDGELRIY